MAVEVTFPDLPPAPLEVVMSRTSPGRYAIHEFASNVSDVQIDDGAGAPLRSSVRTRLSGTCRPSRRGARALQSVRRSARRNISSRSIRRTRTSTCPPSLMWARGLEDRPVRVTFDTPRGWKVATQLQPDKRTPYVYRGQPAVPDGQPDRAERVHAAHVQRRRGVSRGRASRRQRRRSRPVRRRARKSCARSGGVRRVSGIRDAIYLHRGLSAWRQLRRDGAPEQHDPDRPATRCVGLTSSWCSSARPPTSSSIAGTSSEFVPRSLEPFKLDAPNPSGELWFAEGVTSYYERLVMRRAGSLERRRWQAASATCSKRVRSPARKYRSAEEVSRLAQFVDQAAWSDPTNFDNTSCPITLGRGHWPGSRSLAASANRSEVTLDHYMRRLWQEYGQSRRPSEGGVARPVHDQRSPRTCWRRFPAILSSPTIFSIATFKAVMSSTIAPIAGACRAVVEQARTGSRMDRSRDAGVRRGRRVSEPTVEDTPVYAAGLDRGDEMLSIDGDRREQPRAAGGSHSAPEPGRHKSACRFAVEARTGAHDHDRRGPAPAGHPGRTDRAPADGRGAGVPRRVVGSKQ